MKTVCLQKLQMLILVISVTGSIGFSQPVILAEKHFNLNEIGACNMHFATEDGYILVGERYSEIIEADPPYSNVSGTVLKIDLNGNLIWSQYVESDSLRVFFNRISRLDNDRFLITGSANFIDPIQYERMRNGQIDHWYPCIIINSNGEILHKYYYSCIQHGSINTAIPTIDGNFILIGDISAADDVYDVVGNYIEKATPDGRVLWRKEYSDPNLPETWDHESFINAFIMDDGQIVTIKHERREHIIFRTFDSEGNFIGRNVSPAIPFENPFCEKQVIKTRDNKLLLTYTRFPAEDNELVFDSGLMKTDINGNIEWMKHWRQKGLGNDEEKVEWFCSVTECENGKIILLGRTELYGIDDQGNVSWTLPIAMEENLTDVELNFVSSDDNSIVCVTGQYPNVELHQNVYWARMQLADDVIVEDDLQQIALISNYPNPFNTETNISFNVPQTGNVQVTIYNSDGRLIKTLINSDLHSGSYEVPWNAEGLPAGQYHCRLRTISQTQLKPIMLIK